jgi:hypothetical protein
MMCGHNCRLLDKGLGELVVGRGGIKLEDLVAFLIFVV